MLIEVPDVLLTAGLSIFLFIALCAALVLVVISLRRPTSLLLGIAAGLLVAATTLAAVAPSPVPLLMGLILALLGIAIGVVGGNPVTRHVLRLATRSRLRESPDGGILLPVTRNDETVLEPTLRGGTTIGYLERVGVVMAIIAGYPEAIAIVVAIKGIGRFSELTEADTRERFIIGTLASLVWACVAGAFVRLALW